MCPVFVKQDIYFLSSYMEGLEETAKFKEKV